MSWSYSGDPSLSDLDMVRFLCGDTDSDAGILTDEELQFLLCGSTPRQAALKAGERILAVLAREVSYRIGPESVTAGDRYKQYKDWWLLAKNEMLKDMAAPTWQEPTGTHRKSIFDIGMNDNRRW